MYASKFADIICCFLAHLPAIFASKSYDLKAVYSRTRASAQKVASLTSEYDEGIAAPEVYYDIDGGSSQDVENVEALHSLQGLLERPDIQAVIIALPIMQQPRFIRLALENGKHVLSEKPIAATVEDAQELIEFHQSKYSNLIWGVTECFRYEPAFAYAAERVRSLGKLSFFTFTWAIEVLETNPYYQTAWRKKPDYQGGFLLDAGVHFASELRQILGSEVTQVAAFGRIVKPFLAPVDTISSVCLLENGVSGTFMLSAASSKTINELIVVGERGSVIVKTGNNDNNQEVAPVVVLSPQDPEGKSFDFVGVNRSIATFALEVESGKQEHRSTPEEALKDLKLIQALLKSGEQAGKLQSCSHKPQLKG